MLPKEIIHAPATHIAKIIIHIVLAKFYTHDKHAAHIAQAFTVNFVLNPLVFRRIYAKFSLKHLIAYAL